MSTWGAVKSLSGKLMSHILATFSDVSASRNSLLGAEISWDTVKRVREWKSIGLEKRCSAAVVLIFFPSAGGEGLMAYANKTQ